MQELKSRRAQWRTLLVKARLTILLRHATPHLHEADAQYDVLLAGPLLERTSALAGVNEGRLTAMGGQPEAVTG